jgi:hypothetical protein
VCTELDVLVAVMTRAGRGVGIAWRRQANAPGMVFVAARPQLVAVAGTVEQTGSSASVHDVHVTR